jgi:tRNA(fMet)-specific endonuclease VapC
MICLDTNAAISLLSGRGTPVRSRFEEALKSGETVAASSIVLFELWFGSAKSVRREGNARKIVELVASPIDVLNFDEDDAREAGDIRADLRRKGTPIGPYDILIAAQARRRDALLVTANVREFARVPRLRTEDWSVALQREE